ncbi:MAG: protein-tyrosine-phosphatase [Lewinellaceae bacterium]|nr:protein-tyrosine-phosphatase [Phaeodactylibacter sp.]MCB9038723.1 protein-tyrosine-phosphatase [Lewinellaceae bacterium]
MQKPRLFESLEAYLSTLPVEFGEIPEARKAILDKLVDYVARQRRAGKPAQLTVICTHNSRRSHIGQMWAAAAAAWYGLEEVYSFSGGTEATAFNPNAVAALQRAGFRINRVEEGKNPVYEAGYSESLPPLRAFSKRFDAAENPDQGFAAIMVCSEADEACPFVPGADIRLPLPFEDPKRADGTPEEQQAYDEACRLIAREICYSMEQAARRGSLSSRTDLI